MGGLPPHLAALALVGATRKAPEAEKKTVEFAQVVTPTPLPTMVVPTSMPNIDVASMPSEAASVAVSQPSVMISTSKHAQAYSIAAWQDCLSQWRLNPMQLGIADKLVRLVSDDDNKVILACPPHERGALGLLRDKLTQAIERAQPGAKVVWVDDWQDGWLSLATHNQAISQQIQDDAKAHIANNPHFQQTCQVLGLQPNWAQLTPLVTPSTETPSA